MIAAAVAIALGWLAWKCQRDPAINFLPGDSRAEWIVFPAALDARTHPVGMIDATFRRTFVLDSQPKSARLEFRAAKRLECKINDQSIPLDSVPNWKRRSIVDVSRFLRSGENKIEARVFNDDAPPALWMFLSTDSFTLRTNHEWESSIAGSSWRNCALASVPRQPGPGNVLFGGEKTFDVLATARSAWILFAIGGLVVAIVATRWLKDANVDLAGTGGFIAIGVCVMAWGILFWNNAKMLPFLGGYDFTDHVAYIKYIQDRGALPLPNEGYEMFQPPLFYAIAAGMLSILHLSTGDAAAVSVLRALTMIFGIANFIFVLLSARLLFPRRPLAQLIALIAAAFLPMQLYLSHYVTNETLAATLATMSIYFALRVLISERATLWQIIAVGMCAGAAMLAKATSLLIIPPLIAAFAIRLWQQRASASGWARTLGSTIAAMILVCGWHYLRIWRHFGTPIVGNWDAVLGFPWWQDPGFHTAGDYLRFGRSLVAPMFSGFNGFADGIYSTLWGDSLGGGLSGLLSRTPWNYSFMIGSYWLAIIPALLVLIGAVIALYRLAKKISAEWFLLIAFSGAVAFGLIFMTLRVPSYAQVKAFYGLAAVVPFCAFIAVGWETITARSRIARIGLSAFVIFFAINSFAAVWIRPTVQQRTYLAIRSVSQSQNERALSEATQVVKEDPANAGAHCFLAAVFDEIGDRNSALTECANGLNLDQASGDCHLQLGITLAKEGGDFPKAREESGITLRLQPENARAYDLAFTIARALHDPANALELGRDALAVTPFDASLHYRIGLAAGELGDFAIAAQQFAYALLLDARKPEHAEKLRLALSFFARTPDAPNVVRELQPLAVGSPKLLEILADYRQNPNSTTQDRP